MLLYLKEQQMSNAMTVIQAKVETKLKYVSTARKRQKCRGTMYTSEGSDWSTGINICSGLLGLRLNILIFRSLIPPSLSQSSHH